MKTLAVSDFAKLLAGCASLALATGVAHAQATPDGGQVQDTGQVEDTSAPPAAANDSQDIVITAQRQSQNLSRVPLSVAAFSQATLDNQGVKAIADIQRITPGISFNKAGQGTTNIAVRGVSSSVGAGTTAIYIDDTPVQVRTLGFAASNAYPTVFDLGRVEVLRGPQGTLFGAGAEGGAVRFITPQPSLSSYSGYARAEVSTTKNGSPSFEMGAALGGPLIDDVLGFRVSAFFRREGGYIDKVAGTAQVVSSTGAAGPQGSLNFIRNGTQYKDADWSETTALRAALTFSPTGNLKITPAILYQKQYINDAAGTFWPAASDYSTGDFATPQWVSTVDAGHIAIPGEPKLEPMKDRFVLPSLAIDWGLGGVRLVSNTSFFTRRQSFVSDYTITYERLYAGKQVPAAGDRAITYFTNGQDNFVQEVRLQSDNSGGRFTWVIGGYYSATKQVGTQEAHPNFIGTINSLGGAVTNGPPFGPGYGAFVNYYGIDLINGVSYRSDLMVKERHYAAFAQADYEVFDGLKLTAGVRAERAKFTYDGQYQGANLNQNAPHGLACVPNSSPCIPVAVGAYKPGEGPFAPVYGNGGSSSSESPITPKFGISYQANANNLFYASASKGYRIGGAQSALPTLCNAQLASLGFTGSPSTYKSDSLWSYEVGSKNKLFGGAVQLAASAFYIKWSNIQTSVSLSSCSNSFVTNANSATSRGFDAQIDLRPTDNFTLTVAAGYTKATFDDALILSGKVTYSKGSVVPSSGPPWIVRVSGQYDIPVGGTLKPYIRADYTFNGAQGRTGVTDPATVNYDPLAIPVPSNALVNGRVGLTVLDRVSVALFVNNLLDAHPHLGLSRTKGQPIYTDYTFRPRTIGIQLSSSF